MLGAFWGYKLTVGRDIPLLGTDWGTNRIPGRGIFMLGTRFDPYLLLGCSELLGHGYIVGWIYFECWTAHYCQRNSWESLSNIRFVIYSLISLLSQPLYQVLNYYLLFSFIAVYTQWVVASNILLNELIPTWIKTAVKLLFYLRTCAVCLNVWTKKYINIKVEGIFVHQNCYLQTVWRMVWAK